MLHACRVLLLGRGGILLSSVWGGAQGSLQEAHDAGIQGMKDSASSENCAARSDAQVLLLFNLFSSFCPSCVILVGDGCLITGPCCTLAFLVTRYICAVLLLALLHSPLPLARPSLPFPFPRLLILCLCVRVLNFSSFPRYLALSFRMSPSVSLSFSGALRGRTHSSGQANE